MNIHSLTVGDGVVDVVFLHGLFGQGKNWTTIARGISPWATSHLVDLPNHGKSGWTLDFDFDEHAEIIADWLRESFDFPVVLVGHSMGGKVAMRLAIRYPELVAGLVVVDISPARNESVLGFTSLVAGLHSLDLEKVASRGYADRTLSERIPDDTVRRFLLQNLVRDGDSWTWAANLDLLGDELHAISGWKPISGTYDGPVMWLRGGKSDYVRPEHQAPMRELFPTEISVTLKRAGHWVHADDPEAFVDVLITFLRELPASR